MVVLFLVSLVMRTDLQSGWRLQPRNPMTLVQTVDDRAPVFLFAANVTLASAEAGAENFSLPSSEFHGFLCRQLAV
jgi:hypothetical protein